MMWDSRFPGLFLFLGQIIQEEINENSIDLCIRMRADNFPAEHFNSPDAATA